MKRLFMMSKTFFLLFLCFFSSFLYANNKNNETLFYISKITHNKLLIETIHSFDENWASQISTFFETIYLDEKFSDLTNKYDRCILENTNKEDIENSLNNISLNCDFLINEIKTHIKEISKRK